MVWRGTELAHEAIKHGYDVVMSPELTATSICIRMRRVPSLWQMAVFIPTEKVYSYVPGSDLPEAERNMITGVQANLWHGAYSYS